MQMGTENITTIRPHVKRELMMFLAEKATLKEQLQLSFNDLEAIAEELQIEIGKRVRAERELSTYKAFFGEMGQVLSL